VEGTKNRGHGAPGHGTHGRRMELPVHCGEGKLANSGWQLAEGRWRAWGCLERAHRQPPAARCCSYLPRGSSPEAASGLFKRTTCSFLNYGAPA
jgi:hypothetical protein